MLALLTRPHAICICLWSLAIACLRTARFVHKAGQDAYQSGSKSIRWYMRMYMHVHVLLSNVNPCHWWRCRQLERLQRKFAVSWQRQRKLKSWNEEGSASFYMRMCPACNGRDQACRQACLWAVTHKPHTPPSVRGCSCGCNGGRGGQVCGAAARCAEDQVPGAPTSLIMSHKVGWKHLYNPLYTQSDAAVANYLYVCRLV